MQIFENDQCCEMLESLASMNKESEQQKYAIVQ